MRLQISPSNWNLCPLYVTNSPSPSDFQNIMVPGRPSPMIKLKSWNPSASRNFCLRYFQSFQRENNNKPLELKLLHHLDFQCASIQVSTTKCQRPYDQMSKTIGKLCPLVITRKTLQTSNDE